MRQVKVFTVSSTGMNTLANEWERQLEQFLNRNMNRDVVITQVDSSIVKDDEALVNQFIGIFTVVYKRDKNASR